MSWLYWAVLAVVGGFAYRNLRQQGHTKKFEDWLMSVDMRMRGDDDGSA